MRWFPHSTWRPAVCCALAFLLAGGLALAQVISVPVKKEKPTKVAALAQLPHETVHLSPSLPSLAFGNQQVNVQTSAQATVFTNAGPNSLTGIAAQITGNDAGDFKIQTGANACASTLGAGASCSIYVTFTPSAARSYSAVLEITYGGATSPASVILSGTGTSKNTQCWLLPMKSECIPNSDSLNQFFGVADQISFLHQVKSIYNGVSGSDTVSADIVTLYFPVGFEISAGTNIQAGSGSSSAVSSGTTPTLSSSSAAQATQNLLYGGTVVANVSYPLIAVGASGLSQSGNFGTSVDIVGQEGVDVQNFKSGTSSSATAPPSHSSLQLEGYAQYNSTNLSQNGTYEGAIFLGFAYGYNYMSHGYQRDYGFSSVNNGVGQVSAGILISGVARISVSRGFGPSQTYIDSTSMLTTKVNNFKAWSFGISYQSAGSK